MLQFTDITTLKLLPQKKSMIPYIKHFDLMDEMVNE